MITRICCLAMAIVLFMSTGCRDRTSQSLRGRQEVIFWHFWGGEDRAVVESVVERFNASQSEHFVRAIAMPGNNLDMKLFLAVTGGDPPDLVNQDDPILADWAERGAIIPLDELATPAEINALGDWLFASAQQLGTYQGRLYGLCNGLDIRALFYNQTLLDDYQLRPPTTLADLDRIANTIAPTDGHKATDLFGFLPNPKLLWAWGIVFGGSFFDEDRQQVTLDDAPIIAALDWMAGYGQRYGSSAVSFRTRDQSLPGKTFPLLAGRYATIVDGQWRVRDIAAAQAAERAADKPVTQYGVCPLPPPPGGLDRAGWVNGNFFIVPRGANNTAGAWAFMKFWIGLDGATDQAAKTCAAGGWIPVSQQVVDSPAFQSFLQRQPLFQTFVELAASPHQRPRPNVPHAQMIDRELRNAAAQAIYRAQGRSTRQLLEAARKRIESER